ncbi:MAG: hypothetical protein GY814_19825, partial [Gammaproteobacteria bacterium]|nr:hypothetical protein [Gammaproteobacteria bacterium]
MNKLYSIILYLLLANSNTVFSNEQVSIDSNIIFSDSEYEGPNTGHVIKILDFIIGPDDIAYSVVRLRELPSQKVSYKLFVTNNKEFKSYYLKELSDYENVTIGVMGFDNSGRLKIPVILGSKNRGSVNRTLNLYEYNNGKISYTSDLLPDNNISSAVYNKDILFISDRRGGLHLYKNDGETISIKKQKIERIRDVKVQGENAFILSN